PVPLEARRLKLHRRHDRLARRRHRPQHAAAELRNRRHRLMMQRPHLLRQRLEHRVQPHAHRRPPPVDRGVKTVGKVALLLHSPGANRLSQSHIPHPTSHMPPPTKLDLKKDKGLTVEWPDGATSYYSIAYLRRMSPSAEARDLRDKLKKNPLTVLPASAVSKG